jgi:pSer/pThr/pTyr-binding forkhead associated (FHA) protein
MSIPQSISARIFVSHSSKDTEFGLRLADDLRRVLGDPTSVWFDVSGGLHGGDAWWRTIVAEVTTRPIFVVIWSPDARDSSWVNDEIDLAWNQKNDPGGKRIIPLLYRDCALREDLRTRQSISFLNMQEYEQRFAELLSALALVQSASPGSTAQPTVPTAPPGSAVVSGVPASPSAPLSGVVAPQEPELEATHLSTPLIATVQGQPDPRPELLILSIDSVWPPVRVPLQSDVVTIGRESSNDVSVADPAVSRFHLRLNRKGSGWHVEILPGARPLYVNGEFREAAWLGHRDQLVIGGTVLRFEQMGWFSTATTMKFSDSRTIRASGLTPELLVELPQVTFTVSLRTLLISLGRAPTSALVIPSPLISAQHALLRRSENGSYELEAASDVVNRFAPEGQSVPPHQPLLPDEKLLIGSRLQNRYVALTYRASFSASSVR